MFPLGVPESIPICLFEDTALIILPLFCTTFLCSTLLFSFPFFPFPSILDFSHQPANMLLFLPSWQLSLNTACPFTSHSTAPMSCALKLFKRVDLGVPVVAQWLMNLTSNDEVAEKKKKKKKELPVFALMVWNYLYPSFHTITPLKCFFCLFVCLVLSFVILGPHPWHMEVPRLGVESELQLLASTTDTATWDLSCVSDLRHSSWQRRILNPLSEARDQVCILMYTGQVC